MICLIEAQEVVRRVDRHGFAVLRDVLHDDQVMKQLAILAQSSDSPGVSRRGQVYAIRHLLELVPAVRELADSLPVRRLVGPLLGPNAFPVQGIFFDKPADANWKVPWHQDLSIPVKERVEAPGFGPWSMKADVLHVQAPSELLERMLIVRLHLDENTEANGPLRVIAGSQRHGRLSREQLEWWRDHGEEIVCTAPRGGALLMRPLLLHASSATRTPAHRRVIHLEYAAEQLPDGLAWAVDST
jgi:hypothetical protein